MCDYVEFSNLPPEKAGMVRNNVVGGGGVGGGGRARVHGPPPPVVGRIIKPDLKVYTFSELKSATRNFRPDSVLGEGGFGRVYKGWIDKTTLAPSKVGVGIPVAVKKCSADSAQGLKEWKVSFLFPPFFLFFSFLKILEFYGSETKMEKCFSKKMDVEFEYVTDRT